MIYLINLQCPLLVICTESHRMRVQEHLACFLPATLVLGVIHGLDKSHLEMAANLTKTCYAMYQQTATGLSADVVSMNIDPHEGKDIFIRVILTTFYFFDFTPWV